MKYNLTQDLVTYTQCFGPNNSPLGYTCRRNSHINPKGAMKRHSLMREVRGSLSVQRSRDGSNLWMHAMDYSAAVRSNTLHAHLGTESILT